VVKNPSVGCILRDVKIEILSNCHFRLYATRQYNIIVQMLGMVTGVIAAQLITGRSDGQHSSRIPHPGDYGGLAVRKRNQALKEAMQVAIEELVRRAGGASKRKEQQSGSQYLPHAASSAETNVFGVAAMVIQSRFPRESKALMACANRYFTAHPDAPPCRRRCSQA
jgi:hypothetical protein